MTATFEGCPVYVLIGLWTQSAPLSLLHSPPYPTCIVCLLHTSMTPYPREAGFRNVRIFKRLSCPCVYGSGQNGTGSATLVYTKAYTYKCSNQRSELSRDWDAVWRHRRLVWAGKRRSVCSNVTVQKSLIVTLVYITLVYTILGDKS